MNIFYNMLDYSYKWTPIPFESTSSTLIEKSVDIYPHPFFIYVTFFVLSLTPIEMPLH